MTKESIGGGAVKWCTLHITHVNVCKYGRPVVLKARRPGVGELRSFRSEAFRTNGEEILGFVPANR